MDRWRRLIRHDWSLRITALIIAFVLWILASGQPYSAQGIYSTLAKTDTQDQQGSAERLAAQKTLPVYVAVIGAPGESVQVVKVDPAQVNVSGSLSDLRQINMLIARWRPGPDETATQVSVLPLDRRGQIVPRVHLDPNTVAVSAHIIPSAANEE